MFWGSNHNILKINKTGHCLNYNIERISSEKLPPYACIHMFNKLSEQN